ncbi:MAG: hypothetical protein JW981_04910, partial [Anaerolineae bacterium]|nr:hypothetical protein [Anaerolineae bacterium]
VDYFDQADIAKIHFSFTRLGDAPAEPPVVVSTTTPTPAPGSDVPGYAWYGQYYNNQGLSGDPLVTRMDENIGFEWDNDAPMKDFPADFFSVHWARQVELYADNYEFCARADDGVQIFVDGTLVLDAWHPSDASQNYCNEVDIPKAGLHIVDVYYYEHGGEALIYVWWDRH